ncbi:MAG: hypothetical protein QOJ84_989, partial [Bradyrhizobium sp.]|nr:hypothetical protein [Bradyrhizobium sp.]
MRSDLSHKGRGGLNVMAIQPKFIMLQGLALPPHQPVGEIADGLAVD